MICESQSAVFAFLSSPRAYGGEPVQCIETHLSYVFLVGARVYKIKKALRYDFVDFSNIALRKAACAKEVAINKRTAPDIYLGIVPIFCVDGHVCWDGAGDPVEWAVEMKRFAPGNQFDELLALDRLEEKAILQLADKIASFHKSADIKRGYRRTASMGAVLDQLATDLHDHEICITREKDVTRWSTLAFKAYETHYSFMEARRRHGWVRHCHGDLHLANICMFEGEATPFDAIEFNDDLVTIDVLYDIAFTLMDLINHNRTDLANALLNRYLSATRDYSGLRVLPLFLSMRAAVRAMVLSLPTQPEDTRRLAHRYLDLALEFLVGESQAHMVAIGGLSGTGKSTLAKALARQLNGRYGAIVLNSDVARKRIDGKLPEERLPIAQYNNENTTEIYRRIMKDARRVLRSGASVILDATFLEKVHRVAAANVSKATGTEFSGVWLVAPGDMLRTRIENRIDDASDATVDVLDKQLARHSEQPTDWKVINTRDGLRNTLETAQRFIEESTGCDEQATKA